jgi:hypothetical protein
MYSTEKRLLNLRELTGRAGSDFHPAALPHSLPSASAPEVVGTHGLLSVTGPWPSPGPRPRPRPCPRPRLRVLPSLPLSSWPDPFSGCPSFFPVSHSRASIFSIFLRALCCRALSTPSCTLRIRACFALSSSSLFLKASSSAFTSCRAKCVSQSKVRMVCHKPIGVA